MIRKIFLFAVLVGFLISCGLFKKSPGSSKGKSIIALDTAVKYSDSEKYHGSRTRLSDIIHTKLDVQFDWSKAYLLGKATITAKPYFYPADKIELNARGMDIHEVDLVSGDSLKKKLDYKYENDMLSIQLDKTYKKDEIYKIYIDYTAKPNELKSGGSEAIKDDKGLYFINADGAEKNKPQQIWTQGETQSSSCWFPTIDSPNEKMTDEIYITVDKKYTTLSNGELAFSTDNPDGTRTDCWKMELPHSTYLLMMAIGEFSVVKDTWKDKEVNYYVEKEYEPYARAIFGRTPEMIDLFSEKLGVPYPWNKYSQVVVRDYVSGAMENTTATLHGEFMQRTERELLDQDYEDVIAHELFHQWFGDLATCESWSNLPLNESFANYGEYIWIEHKLGADEADRHIQSYLSGYLREAASKQVNLIRFYYDDKEDMFDSHSYNKGGRVIHMLRKYVGDEAFFASLKLYLETNKFSTTEIHNLRLAFEQVTGEDLNWFFNQWFLSSGHPQLTISWNYNEATKKETVNVNQTQDTKTTPVFKLPLSIDVYYNGKKDRHQVAITKTKENFVFDVPVKPDLVNFDGEKVLLCTKEENKTAKELTFQYNNAPLYLDRYEALSQFTKRPSDSLTTLVLMSALNDKFWGLRSFTIRNGLKKIITGKEKQLREKLVTMLQNDQESSVRVAAINFLTENYKDEDLKPVYKEAVNDRSYAVLGAAMAAIAKMDHAEGLSIAKTYEKEKSETISSAVAGVYSDYGSDENNDFFVAMYERSNGYDFITFASQYSDFLKKCNNETVNKGVELLTVVSRKKEKWVRFYGQRSIKELADNYVIKQKDLKTKIKSLRSANPNDPKVKESEKELEEATNQEKKLRDLYATLSKEDEEKKDK